MTRKMIKIHREPGARLRSRALGIYTVGFGLASSSASATAFSAATADFTLIFNLLAISSCAAASSRSRYFRSRRRSLTFLSNPRREEKSFLCVLRWSMRNLISSVRIAICTCGDPVSPPCVWNFLMSLSLAPFSNIYADIALPSHRCQTEQPSRRHE